MDHTAHSTTVYYLHTPYKMFLGGRRGFYYIIGYGDALCSVIFFHYRLDNWLPPTPLSRNPSARYQKIVLKQNVHPYR